jgi:hypothetical protein
MSDLINKAVRNSTELGRLAVDAAVKRLSEELEPGIRRLIERQLDSLGENSTGDGQMPKNNDAELDLESIAGFFPAISEMDQEDGEAIAEGDYADLDESDIPSLDEAAEGDLDEEIELDESQLAAAVQEALHLEVQMKSGFGDMSKPDTEINPKDGIHDIKSGESMFDEVEPPAAKDWTVSEVRKLVAQGLKENETLRAMLAKEQRLSKKLKEHLQKVNLFNAKMLSANKFFVENKLNRKQQKVVIESLDKAGSVDEVKKIYSTLSASFRSTGVVSESRKASPKANSQRVRTQGSTQNVIRESADKSAPNNYGRWQRLAGLKNIKG